MQVFQAISRTIIMSMLVFFTAPLSFGQFQSNPFDMQASMVRGETVYMAHCATCHQKNGEGIEGVYPPLAKSDYLMAEKKRIIRQLMEGAAGEMTVNGIAYYGVMPAFALHDGEIVDVLNYIRNSWGNHGEAVLPDEVKKERAQKTEP